MDLDAAVKAGSSGKFEIVPWTPNPSGRVPGFETKPSVSMTRIENLLKPFEHLNFEIVSDFVLRISSNAYINKHLPTVIFV